jgi:hypothetical protein
MNPFYYSDILLRGRPKSLNDDEVDKGKELLTPPSMSLVPLQQQLPPCSSSPMHGSSQHQYMPIFMQKSNFPSATTTYRNASLAGNPLLTSVSSQLMDDFVREKMLLDNSVRSLTESRSLNDTKRGYESLQPPATLSSRLLVGRDLISYMNSNMYSPKDNYSPKHDSGPLRKKAKLSSVDVAKGQFPCPPLSGKERNPPSLRLSKYRKTWERLERMSDLMDDTAEDQEAFIKEFFIRSLHKRKRLS